MYKPEIILELLISWLQCYLVVSFPFYHEVSPVYSHLSSQYIFYHVEILVVFSKLVATGEPFSRMGSVWFTCPIYSSSYGVFGGSCSLKSLLEWVDCIIPGVQLSLVLCRQSSLHGRHHRSSPHEMFALSNKPPCTRNSSSESPCHFEFRSPISTS